MSGGIEEPYTIASLPKPLNAENGRIHTGVVHSLNASRKRKRHEIAIGVDGESVNIYNVQNQGIASSYAIPPQSYLAAPPCSIYCKRTKPLPSQRYTYLAVRNSPKDQKVRLIGIAEDLGKPQNEEAQPRAPVRTERKLRHGNVAGLDVIPTADLKELRPAIVVSYRNGDVDCVAGDLGQTRWEHTSQANVEVEYATVVDFETARRGLLKNREDVLALVESSNATNGSVDAPPLLCQITRSEEKRHFRIFALRNVAGMTLQGQRSPLEELVEYHLPDRQSQSEFQYELHPGSGMLYQKLGLRFAVYDLSGTVPKTVMELGKKVSQQVESFTRVSAGAVITVGQNRVSVHDTKFGSVMDSLALSTSKTHGKPPKLTLLSNFTDLGVVAALSGTDLVALQLGESLEDARKSRPHGALLGDVFGKGKFSGEAQQLDAFDGKERKIRRWEAWIAEVDQLVAADDVQGLEARVKRDIALKRPGELSLTNGMSNGHSAAASRKDWDLLPQHFDPQHLNRRKTVYILGKVFAWRSKHSGFVLGQKHLQLVITSRNILRWLALAGYLTSVEVEHALPQTSGEFSARPYIAPGDITRAISDADPSFELLCALVALPTYWDLHEVVQGVKTLIESFEDQTQPGESDLLLTTGDVDMADAEDDRSEAQIEAQELAALREVERVTNVLEGGRTRSNAFRRCIDRLLEFSHADIAKAMRMLMSQDEIIFLIHIMRVELSNGGWTKMYDGTTEDDVDPDFTGLGEAVELSPSNQAIRTIATMISCAIDAIGLSGWLVGQSGSDWSTSELIKSIQNETSAVIEGIYYAETLDTLLRDIQRTAASAQQNLLKRKQDALDLTPEQTLMPLGGRLDPPILADGKRSKKALEYEQKNRSVGKYSFEQIRI